MSDSTEILALQQRVAALEQIVATVGRNSSRVNGPLQRVLLVKRNSDTPKIWQEWTVANNAFVEFPGGRKADAESSPGAVKDPFEEDDGDDFAYLLEVQDLQDGSPVSRYVLIGGGSGGIQDIRLNGDGTWVQVTRKTDPAEEDWENKIEVSPQCTTPTPTP